MDNRRSAKRTRERTEITNKKSRLSNFQIAYFLLHKTTIFVPMTGSQIYGILKALYDFPINGIVPTASVNKQLEQIQGEYFKPMFKLFGENGEINAELEPLMQTFSVATPTNNKVSKTTDMTNYFGLINLDATFVVNGNTYTNTASPLPPNAMKGSFSDGTFLYPKYFIVNNDINISPSTVQCTLAEGNYFRTPFAIDVTDSTTQLTYNLNTITGIVRQLLSAYGLSLSDPRYQQWEREIMQTNNTVLR